MKYGKGEDVTTITCCTVAKDLRHQCAKAEMKYILDWKSLARRADCEMDEGEEDIQAG